MCFTNFKPSNIKILFQFLPFHCASAFSVTWFSLFLHFIIHLTSRQSSLPLLTNVVILCVPGTCLYYHDALKDKHIHGNILAHIHPFIKCILFYRFYQNISDIAYY
ncbi:unnamed protein product [Musa textilis]